MYGVTMDMRSVFAECSAPGPFQNRSSTARSTTALSRYSR